MIRKLFFFRKVLGLDGFLGLDIYNMKGKVLKFF